MATHSSIFAWKIPWTEEPGGLQSMGSQRVRHNLATKSPQTLMTMTVFYCFIYMCMMSLGEGNGTSLQYSCLENPMGRGAW